MPNINDNQLQGVSSDNSKHTNVASSSHVQMEDRNAQDVSVHMDALVAAIDGCNISAEEKMEARSVLKEFLEQPIVVAILAASNQ